MLVHINKLPSEDRKVCFNCKHFVLWGCFIGMCDLPEIEDDVCALDTCDKFNKKITP